MAIATYGTQMATLQKPLPRHLQVPPSLYSGVPLHAGVILLLLVVLA